MSDFAILVNTTDTFEDCWLPFFKLFKTYWPEYSGKIYLNTEENEFVFGDLNIVSVQNRLSGQPWGMCLKRAIGTIQEEHILYLQDDYFLHDRVNHKMLTDLFEAFRRYNYDCLHLTDQCTPGPFKKETEDPAIWEILKGADYRLSTQAAFWKKSSLLKLVRGWENAWQFEHYGSMRTAVLTKRVMVVNTNEHGIGKTELLPYIFTGIIKGAWKKEVVPLFENNGIRMDFSIRGFVPETATTKKKTKKMSVLFNMIRSRLDLIFITR